MLIRNLWRSLTEYQRIKLCNDVTAGLLALHQAGAVHGDVKSENVLVFSSSNEKDAYIAKVADFGSAIIVGEQEEPDAQRPWRYQGTPTVNAPEVADQTSARLSATGLRKCDNYSLGLLILEVAVGYLDEEAETKASSVLEHAIAHIEGTEFSDASKTTLKAAIQRLLQFSNENRCGDLSVIEHIFNPLAVEQLDVTKYVGTRLLNQ